ncbi:UDP-Glc:alpha-D-GlcNAc-diphosphoundecaprenol beta-1,3-glucosyltransferase WfgD (plasmid) [Roseovarius sp. THAF27]|uniref:glycosyltransferase family 2 protein n=1 Tax=Roseovarius sp. THAF27 TaxID=2587850 RepID=UPI0012A9B1E1|nr:glycosyltransferase family 2 protein [Roseovarius sp. THAF27]QFT83295.1 UDP-Glc:alpha-D-GlcNAc-diphosphoundecaprenol beta-1,3-glucosyltransferase WfgD [Roseovarius sp. THAF27]
MPDRQRFTILLCTYQGERHLPAQLESYLAQTYKAWDLWVSDDGSRDATRALIEAFRAEAGPDRTVRIITGPGQGATRNFLSLLCHPDLPPGPVALSDQDDIWLPHKLERAAAALSAAAPVTLYGAQSHYVDAALQPIGKSPLPRRAPSFANALTQNIVSGYTMVLNDDALALARRAGVPAAALPYHDWWLYQLISGAGGTVAIDTEPAVLYRQHGDNVMGAHHGMAATLRRMRMVLDRRYGDWLDANMTALEACDALLTPDARSRLAAVRAVPRGHTLRRVLAFARAGLHRQTRRTTAMLYLAAALGRV